ncbi:hypothetical protein PHYSODRAFT_484533, partial [Phytophthora sojae]
AAPVPACVSPNRSEIASPAPLLPVPTLSKTDPPLPQVARRAQPVRPCCLRPRRHPECASAHCRS